MLSPLKFVDWLTSNFVWGILERVSTKVLEIMLIEHFFHFFLHFFSPIFKRYLLWNSWADWLQMLCEASWGESLSILWKRYLLKFVDRLTSNFMWGIPGRVSTKVTEIVQFLLHFFSPIFKRYLLWSSMADWLQILCDASWGGSLLKLLKLCWLSIFSSFFLHFFQPNFQTLYLLWSSMADWLRI